MPKVLCIRFLSLADPACPCCVRHLQGLCCCLVLPLCSKHAVSALAIPSQPLRQDLKPTSCFCDRNVKRYQHYCSRWEQHVRSGELMAHQRSAIQQKISILEEGNSTVKDYGWLMQVSALASMAPTPFPSSPCIGGALSPVSSTGR